MILQMRLFEEDRQLVDKPLLSHVTLVSTQEQKNFYDLLHFSPLKVCYLMLVPTSSKNTDRFCTPCLHCRSLLSIIQIYLSSVH